METPNTTPANIIKNIAIAAIGAGLLTALADFLFWNHAPGISVAVYCFAVAGVTVAIRWRKWKGHANWVAAGLMLAAGWATALQISFTNGVVLIILLAVVCGECWYEALPSSAARWAESIVAWVCSPGRWPWLFDTAATVAPDLFGSDSRVPARAGRIAKIFAPALGLGIIFSAIFGFGNAVYGDMLNRAGGHVADFVQSFDFSFGHILFLLAAATLGLAFAQPRLAPLAPRKWAGGLPPLYRVDVAVAVWQSRLILLVLNILFFTVNTIDVLYLWWHAKLPAGVTFSAFVHNGIWSLIVAVLLSALVITLIFQQQPEVRRGRLLKIAALVWIAQNLVLIAGVFLRLKLYVNAYELSEERVYVGCFLLLVVTGFILLGLHVAGPGNLNALFLRNAQATFALFFILQFANVAGWVAHYNVARWKHKPQRTLDVAYLASLGPGACPSLVEVASSANDPSGAAVQARIALRQIADGEATRLETTDWRSWQVRRDLQSRGLIAASDQFPPPMPVPMPPAAPATPDER